MPQIKYYRRNNKLTLLALIVSVAISAAHAEDCPGKPPVKLTTQVVLTEGSGSQLPGH